MPKKDITIFDPVEPMWNYRDMIKHLGGVTGLTKKLMDRGFFPPGPDTIQGWATRNSVPGCWAPAVFAIAKEYKIIRTELDALIPPEHTRIGSHLHFPTVPKKDDMKFISFE